MQQIGHSNCSAGKDPGPLPLLLAMALEPAPEVELLVRRMNCPWPDRPARGLRGEVGGSGAVLVDGEEGGERPAWSRADAGSFQNCSWRRSEFQA